MIDIHSHVLAGVDDGAVDLEESRRMLELAAAAGTTDMVATPHSDLRYAFDPAHCDALIQQLTEQFPAGPRLHPGCEVHLTPENIAKVIDKPEDYTLNRCDCVLLELPDRVLPATVSPAIDALTEIGLRVIIAHPERNGYLQQIPSYAEELVGRGCYLQVTARSLSGGFGPHAEWTAFWLLKRRLAHFIASDSHHATTRRPGLSAAFASISKAYGEPAAHTLIIGNPQAAISREPILTMPPAPGWFAPLLSRSMNGLRRQTIPQLPSLR